MQMPKVTEMSPLSAHRREVALVSWSLSGGPRATFRRGSRSTPSRRAGRATGSLGAAPVTVLDDPLRGAGRAWTDAYMSAVRFATQTATRRTPPSAARCTGTAPAPVRPCS